MFCMNSLLVTHPEEKHRNYFSGCILFVMSMLKEAGTRKNAGQLQSLDITAQGHGCVPKLFKINLGDFEKPAQTMKWSPSCSRRCPPVRPPISLAWPRCCTLDAFEMGGRSAGIRLAVIRGTKKKRASGFALDLILIVPLRDDLA